MCRLGQWNGSNYLWPFRCVWENQGGAREGERARWVYVEKVFTPSGCKNRKEAAKWHIRSPVILPPLLLSPALYLLFLFMPLKGYRSRAEALSVALEVEGMPRIWDLTWPCDPCVWVRQSNPECCLLHSPCYTALFLPFLSVYCPLIVTRQIPHEKQQPGHTDDHWSWGDNLTMTADRSLVSIRVDAGEDMSQVGMGGTERGGDTGCSCDRTLQN